MPEGWTRTKLSELLEVLHGYAFSGDSMSERLSGRPIIVSIGNFDYRGGFRFESTRVREFVSHYPPQFELSPGDLLIAMTCQTPDGEILGLPGIVPDDGRTYLHNQRIGRVSLNPKKVDKLFAYYSFLCPEVNRQLVATASGTKILHTAPSRIGAVEINLPPIREQQAIATVLAALDDKIAVNERVARSTDRLIEASYFEARKTAEAAKLPLEQLATVVLGGTPDRKNRSFWTDGTINWINSGKANEFRVTQPSELITAQALDLSTAKIMPRGATIVAITGATMGQVSRVEIETAGNQSLVGVWTEDEDLNNWLYLWIRDHRNNLTKHGTGGAQQHINKAVVASLPTCRLAESDLRRWGAAVKPLFQCVANALQENHALVDLRDTLLPKLMSGEIRVRDAEKAVEEAT